MSRSELEQFTAIADASHAEGSSIPCTALLVGPDPWSEPWGGQMTFAKHLIRAFGSRLAVISTCTAALPDGVWIDRTFEGMRMRYFSVGRFRPPDKRRPLIPARVSVYRMMKTHIRTIFNSGVRNLILDDPELLFPASTLPWNSVCYRFAGLNNPVSNSRYPWLRWLGGPFERRMATALVRINPAAIIAAADEAAIADFKKRIGPPLDSYRIHSFPTRVNTNLFYPESRDTVRRILGLPLNAQIFTVTGRLCWIKGWPLLLDMLRILKDSLPEARLIFVGDGEDRHALLQKAAALGIADRVQITGFVPQPAVRRYINAADVCLVGSVREGWSLAMLEILACGKPIVSTDVSGTRAMVRHGVNGFIVGRDPDRFAAAAAAALQLSDAGAASLAVAREFSVETLARDLSAIWPPIAAGEPL